MSNPTQVVEFNLWHHISSSNDDDDDDCYETDDQQKPKFEMSSLGLVLSKDLIVESFESNSNAKELGVDFFWQIFEIDNQPITNRNMFRTFMKKLYNSKTLFSKTDLWMKSNFQGKGPTIQIGFKLPVKSNKIRAPNMLSRTSSSLVSKIQSDFMKQTNELKDKDTLLHKKLIDEEWSKFRFMTMNSSDQRRLLRMRRMFGFEEAWTDRTISFNHHTLEKQCNVFVLSNNRKRPRPVSLSLGIDGILTWSPIPSQNSKNDHNDLDEVKTLNRVNIAIQDIQKTHLYNNTHDTTLPLNPLDPPPQVSILGLLLIESETFDVVNNDEVNNDILNQVKMTVADKAKNKKTKIPVFIEDIEPNIMPQLQLEVEVGMQLVSIGDCFVTSANHAAELLQQVYESHQQHERNNDSHNSVFFLHEKHNRTHRSDHADIDDDDTETSQQTLPLIFRKFTSSTTKNKRASSISAKKVDMSFVTAVVCDQSKLIVTIRYLTGDRIRYVEPSADHITDDLLNYEETDQVHFTWNHDSELRVVLPARKQRDEFNLWTNYLQNNLTMQTTRTGAQLSSTALCTRNLKDYLRQAKCFDKVDHKKLWGEVSGPLISWLLRRLIRERWNFTYGDKLKKIHSIASDNDDGNDGVATRVKKYGYWEDGRPCGETWVYGRPHELRQNETLFSEHVAQCSPQCGEEEFKVVSPWDAHLTNQIGPDEEVLVYGKQLQLKLPFVVQLSSQPIKPPSVKHAKIKSPLKLKLTDIFMGNSFQNEGESSLRARPIRRERNFGERPIDVLLGMGTLTKGSNMIALTVHLDGPDVIGLKDRLHPGSEIKIGHHVLQVHNSDPLKYPKDHHNDKQPCYIRLRYPFHPTSSTTDIASSTYQTSSRDIIRAACYARRPNPVLFDPEVAHKRAVVLSGEVCRWPLPILFWALLESSHNLLPVGTPLRAMVLRVKKFCSHLSDSPFYVEHREIRDTPLVVPNNRDGQGGKGGVSNSMNMAQQQPWVVDANISAKPHISIYPFTPTIDKAMPKQQVDVKSAEVTSSLSTSTVFERSELTTTIPPPPPPNKGQWRGLKVKHDKKLSKWFDVMARRHFHPTLSHVDIKVPKLDSDGCSFEIAEVKARDLLMRGELNSFGEYGSGGNQLGGRGVGVGSGLVLTSKGGIRVVEQASQAAELLIKPWSHLVKIKTPQATINFHDEMIEARNPETIANQSIASYNIDKALGGGALQSGAIGGGKKGVLLKRWSVKWAQKIPLIDREKYDTILKLGVDHAAAGYLFALQVARDYNVPDIAVTLTRSNQMILHLRKQMSAAGLEEWAEQRPILAGVLLLDPEAPMHLSVSESTQGITRRHASTTTMSSSLHKPISDKEIKVEDIDMKDRKKNSTGLSLELYCHGVELAIQFAEEMLSPMFCSFDSNGQMFHVKHQKGGGGSGGVFDMSSEIWQRIVSDCCATPPAEVMETAFPTDILGRPSNAFMDKHYALKLKTIYTPAYHIYSGVINYKQMRELFSELIDEDALKQQNSNLSNLNQSKQKLCNETLNKIQIKMNEFTLKTTGKKLLTFSKVDDEENSTFKPNRSLHCINQSKKATSGSDVLQRMATDIRNRFEIEQDRQSLYNFEGRKDYFFVPFYKCHICGNTRTYGQMVKGITKCQELNCGGNFRALSTNERGENMQRLSRNYCPQCTAPQTYEEWARGVSRCQFCGVKFQPPQINGKKLTDRLMSSANKLAASAFILKSKTTYHDAVIGQYYLCMHCGSIANEMMLLDGIRERIEHSKLLVGRATNKLLQLEHLCDRSWTPTNITLSTSKEQKIHREKVKHVFGEGYLRRQGLRNFTNQRIEVKKLTNEKLILQARLKEISTHGLAQRPRLCFNCAAFPTCPHCAHQLTHGFVIDSLASLKKSPTTRCKVLYNFGDGTYEVEMLTKCRLTNDNNKPQWQSKAQREIMKIPIQDLLSVYDNNDHFCCGRAGKCGQDLRHLSSGKFPWHCPHCASSPRPFRLCPRCVEDQALMIDDAVDPLDISSASALSDLETLVHGFKVILIDFDALKDELRPKTNQGRVDIEEEDDEEEDEDDDDDDDDDDDEEEDYEDEDDDDDDDEEEEEDDDEEEDEEEEYPIGKELEDILSVFGEWESLKRGLVNVALSVRSEDQDHVGYFNQWEDSTQSDASRSTKPPLMKFLSHDPTTNTPLNQMPLFNFSNTQQLNPEDEHEKEDISLNQLYRVVKHPIEIITGFSISQLRQFESESELLQIRFENTKMNKTRTLNHQRQSKQPYDTSVGIESVIVDAQSLKQATERTMEDKRAARLLVGVDLICSSRSISASQDQKEGVDVSSGEVLVITSTQCLKTVSRIVLQRAKVLSVSVFLRMVRRISNSQETAAFTSTRDAFENYCELKRKVDRRNGRFHSLPLSPNQMKRGFACCPRLLIFDSVLRLHPQFPLKPLCLRNKHKISKKAPSYDLLHVQNQNCFLEASSNQYEKALLKRAYAHPSDFVETKPLPSSSKSGGEDSGEVVFNSWSAHISVTRLATDRDRYNSVGGQLLRTCSMSLTPHCETRTNVFKLEKVGKTSQPHAQGCGSVMVKRRRRVCSKCGHVEPYLMMLRRTFADQHDRWLLPKFEDILDTKINDVEQSSGSKQNAFTSLSSTESQLRTKSFHDMSSSLKNDTNNHDEFGKNQKNIIKSQQREGLCTHYPNCKGKYIPELLYPFPSLTRDNVVLGVTGEVVSINNKQDHENDDDHTIISSIDSQQQNQLKKGNSSIGCSMSSQEIKRRQNESTLWEKITNVAVGETSQLDNEEEDEDDDDEINKNNTLQAKTKQFSKTKYHDSKYQTKYSSEVRSAMISLQRKRLKISDFVKKNAQKLKALQRAPKEKLMSFGPNCRTILDNEKFKRELKKLKIIENNIKKELLCLEKKLKTIEGHLRRLTKLTGQGPYDLSFFSESEASSMSSSSNSDSEDSDSIKSIEEERSELFHQYDRTSNDSNTEGGDENSHDYAPTDNEGYDNDDEEDHDEEDDDDDDD